MKALLVYGSDMNASKIARFLKEIHVKKILPRNILIYSSEKKNVIKTAVVIRDVIKSKGLVQRPSLIDNEVYRLLGSGGPIKRNIFVADLIEIKSILMMLAKNQYGICFNEDKIKEGAIISVNNNGKKVVKTIFTP